MKEKQSVVDTDSSLSRTTLLTSNVETYVCVSFFTKFHDTSGTRCLRDASAEKDSTKYICDASYLGRNV